MAGILAHPDWDVEVLERDDAFEWLGPEWDRLYQRCSSATPFQARTWLASWWRHYGADSGRLVLVGVRTGGTLAAAAALMLRRRGLWRVASLVGTRESDFCDVLVDDTLGDRARWLGRLGAAIREQIRFDVLDFGDVPPGAAAWELFRGWQGPTVEVPGMTCLSFPAKPILEAAGELSGHARQRLNARIRRIDAAGYRVRAVPRAEAATAVLVLRGLHEEQWAGRRISREHRRDRFWAHLVDVAASAPEPGDQEHGAFEAVLYEYSGRGGVPGVDGSGRTRVVALDLMVIGGGMLGEYLYGFRPELRRDVDVTTMLLRNDLLLARERGLATVSLLRGAEPHKLWLRPVPEPNTRLLMAAGVWGLGWLQAIRMRRLAIRVLKKMLGRVDGGARPGTPRWRRGSRHTATPRRGSSRRSFRRRWRGWRSNEASK